jgi:hypothetical protein
MQPDESLSVIEGKNNEYQLTAPPQMYLNELLLLIKIGYVRGVAKKIDEIESLDTKYAIFVSAMRKLAQQFQLAAMKKFVEEINDHA